MVHSASNPWPHRVHYPHNATPPLPGSGPYFARAGHRSTELSFFFAAQFALVIFPLFFLFFFRFRFCSFSASPPHHPLLISPQQAEHVHLRWMDGCIPLLHSARHTPCQKYVTKRSQSEYDSSSEGEPTLVATWTSSAYAPPLHPGRIHRIPPCLTLHLTLPRGGAPAHSVPEVP